MSDTCLVFHDFNPSQLNHLRCSDGSHTHIDDAELREYRDMRLIDVIETPGGPAINWIREPNPKQRTRGVVRLVRQLSIRGQSSKIGAEHALALKEITRRDWAQAMLGNIRIPLPTRHKEHLKQNTNGIRGVAPGPVTIYDHPYERVETVGPSAFSYADLEGITRKGIPGWDDATA